jgi:hypothetical protein
MKPFRKSAGLFSCFALQRLVRSAKARAGRASRGQGSGIAKTY